MASFNNSIKFIHNAKFVNGKLIFNICTGLLNKHVDLIENLHPICREDNLLLKIEMDYFS